MLYLISLIGGIVFGLGLAISRMIDPAKVLNFFDVAGNWDPTLALVFAGAVGVTTPAYQWILRVREKPVVAEAFAVPQSDAITGPLIGGSAIFGVGWGLAGFCPGPGLAALAAPYPGTVLWVIGLFAGAASYRLLSGR
ncbi:MAG: DUF6691 family protein [Pseudomonadota bacterium]